MWPKDVDLAYSPWELPLLVVRVVTRGTYPDLVFDSVSQNLKTLQSVGCKKFVIQVVTENPLDLPMAKEVAQVVVPKNYMPKTGALYKARNLQYCLESAVNCFNDNDWICHMDEESLLTANSAKGKAIYH